MFFENLLGGYIDGSDFIPVRFGLKYPKKGKPVLYVVVNQEKTKTDGFKDRQSKKSTNSTSASVTISIADIIPFVNSKSKDLGLLIARNQVQNQKLDTGLLLKKLLLDELLRVNGFSLNKAKVEEQLSEIAGRYLSKAKKKAVYDKFARAYKLHQQRQKRCRKEGKNRHRDGCESSRRCC